MKISEAFSKADHAFLEERRRLYEQGANIELTTCLAWCFSNEVQPPSWLQQEFINSHLAVMAFEKTWDQVFGDPLPEGKRRATARRNVEKAYEIYCRVQNRGKVPVGNELWEAIGKDLGIGPTIVRDIYYAFRGPIERTLLDV